MTREALRKVAFHNFELDLESGDLTRGGEPVRLAAQPAKALVLLVQKAGELVLRGDIQRHVWGDLVIEQEQGLNTCIRQVRSALGDRSGSPRFIETVPRRGYRFIAPVSALPSPGAPPAQHDLGPSTSAAPQNQPFLGLKRLQVAALTLAILLGLILVLWPSFPGPPPVSDALAERSNVREANTEAPIPGRSLLVVLPFENLGGGSEAFALGLSEEITTELARLEPEWLGVISPGSIRSYGELDAYQDIERIGHDLGVDHVLQGSIRQVGDTARIAIRLVRVADRRHLWAERYDRPLEDVLEVQLEVARRVVEAMAPELLPGPRPVPATDPKAWEAYLQGLHLLKNSSPPDLPGARTALQRALELDPRLARAHVALADSYHAEWRAGNLELQRSALEKALAIDPKLPSAHLRMAKIQLYADWDFAAAGRSFERAVELAPGDAEVRRGYALYLSHLRRHDEAIEHVERARQLDPLSPAVHGDGGNIYFSARRYEQAVEVCERTLELASGHYEARTCLLHAYRRLGRHRQALQQSVELMRLLGATESEVRSVAEGEETSRAQQRFFEWQVEWLHRQNASPVAMAAAVLPLGKTDEVFEWLERAYEQRSGTLLAIAADPRADAFREDPRFVDLLQRVGFPAETIER